MHPLVDVKFIPDKVKQRLEELNDGWKSCWCAGCYRDTHSLQFASFWVILKYACCRQCVNSRKTNYGSSVENPNPGSINLQIGVWCCDISFIWGRESRGVWTALSQVPVSGLTYISCVCERVCKHESKFVLEFVCESDDSAFSSLTLHQSAKSCSSFACVMLNCV